MTNVDQEAVMIVRRDQVIKFIATKMPWHKEELRHADQLEGNLKLDSLDVVEFCMYVEDKFGVILDHEVDKIETVGDIVNLVAEKMGPIQ